MEKTILEQSKTDLLANLAQLLFIAQDSQNKIKSIHKKIRLFPSVSAAYFKKLSEDYTTLRIKIESLKIQTNEVSSEKQIDKIHLHYLNLFYATRSLQSIMAATLTSSDWQSPSYDFSVLSQAGRQEKNIYAAINDYKRDQHKDGKVYEQMFLKNYVNHFPTLFVKIYATSSGMAALATIVGFLKGEKNAQKICVGKESYFENKILLEKLFPDITYFDENNLEELEKLFHSFQPDALFIDSVSNSLNITLPNINKIISIVEKNAKKETTLVVDNTGLSLFFQLLDKQFLKKKNLNILVFESLLKYHQFGMDKVNGGILYGYAKNDEKLYDFRDHMGTNISDVSALTLPSPNKTMLQKKLLLHERNTRYLAQNIDTYLRKAPSRLISHVISPALQSHVPLLRHNTPFHGSLITLAFHKKYQTVSAYKTFQKAFLSQAKKLAVPIAAGTSFGFPTTRIYIPASRKGQGVPFLRIAVGTEPLCIVEKIEMCIKKAIDSSG